MSRLLFCRRESMAWPLLTGKDVNNILDMCPIYLNPPEEILIFIRIQYLTFCRSKYPLLALVLKPVQDLAGIFGDFSWLGHLQLIGLHSIHRHLKDVLSRTGILLLGLN